MLSNKHQDHLDGGAAAVEMELVLPLLLLVLCGIIDFGRGFNAQMQLTQAAREAVRVKALGGTNVEAQGRVDAVTGVRPVSPALAAFPTLSASFPVADCQAGDITSNAKVTA